MYIYHALINTLSAHMIHINLHVILYTHVEHSPTKTIHIKYYLKNNKKQKTPNNNNNKKKKKKKKRYCLLTSTITEVLSRVIH